MPSLHNDRNNRKQSLEAMQIGFDAKRYFHDLTDVGSYSRNVVNGLQDYFPDHQYLLYDEKPLERTFGLARKAVRDGCQVYHGLSNELPLDIVRSKVRSVLTMHDVAWRSFPSMYGSFDRELFDSRYGWSALHADHVVAVSHSTKLDLQHYFGVPEDRISVIYQHVQDSFYTPIPRDEAWRTVKRRIPHLPKDYLLYVGDVDSRRNLLRLLEALAGIPVANRLPLVVVGNGRKYMLDCRNFALEHMRRLDVHWLPEVGNNADLQALYTCATALLCPSVYEGFGLHVVEALLQGCPVLASTHSSLPEAAGPGAILVDPRDTEAIRDGVVRLTEDIDLCRKLARQGEEYCRHSFDPQAQTQKLMALYESLV